jgi:hypothetical protein
VHVTRADGSYQRRSAATAQRKYDKHSSTVVRAPDCAKAFFSARMRLVRQDDQSAPEQLFDCRRRDAVLAAFLAIARVPIEASEFHAAPFYTNAYTNAKLFPRDLLAASPRRNGQRSRLHT